MTAFIGVYKAAYDYEPQTPEELAITEGDLLYLLEKSDVDDWWTVKKRVIGSDAEEPVGLVPSNYVEVAPVINKVTAVYDYDQVQNPDEELTFQENETFDVFDDKDNDWLLVQSNLSHQFGFVPGNYVETSGAAGSAGAADTTVTTAPVLAQTPAAIAPPVVTPADVSAMPPPPQHPNKSKSGTPVENSITVELDAPAMPARNTPNYDEEDDGEDVPPPKPSRPVQETSEFSGQRGSSKHRISYHSGYEEDDYDNNNSNENDTTNGYPDRESRYDAHNDYDDKSKEYHTWNIAEMDGRKKRKCKLSIGGNKIYFQPQKGEPQEWSIDKLTTYDNEKKHMFLEFVDPYKSLELHTGNNDTCSEIMSVIAEFKGASRDPGLKEVELASKSKKQGKILYDFMAESQDELTVKQGQSVYILNDRKSRDWWMCELIGSGQRGVVPAQFVEPIKDKNESSGGILNSFKKFAKGNGSKSHSKTNSSNWKDDDDQDLVSDRKNKSKSRSNSTSRRKRSASASNNKPSVPDSKKTRIWADRSGTFKVEAQFIGCSDGKIHLHKSNGVKIAVAADKLSDEDIIYVERATGFGLDKYKAKKQDTRDARDSERERRKKLKENDEKERDRRIREQELEELKKARLLLDEERAKLQERDLPPIKPPRPQSTGLTAPLSAAVTGTSTPAGNGQPKKNDYDWFEFFLNCGVDVSNCQRYTLNFEREQVTEDMMVDINPAMCRTLGLKEGDIVRVMKYLDNKFGRVSQLQNQVTNAPGGMFSEPDGSLKVSATNNAIVNTPAFATQLLPQKTAPTSGTIATDDDAWTVKPAAKSEVNLSSNKAEFTGSMQDLLDLQPLEPKKKPAEVTPQPKLGDLEPVKSSNTEQTPIDTGIMAPLDPFKTGGHNLLPMTTGFVMMPIATGGFMPMQRTGGMMLPQTTFGMQTTGSALQPQRTSGGTLPMMMTGGVLQPQRTSGGTLPMMVTGGFMPSTSFQTQATSTIVPTQRTGGTLPMTGLNVTSNAPPLGSVLPLQKTATGLIPANVTGGLLPMQRTGGALPMQTTGGLIPLQRTGGLGQVNVTGGHFIQQPSYNNNQLTGGMNMMPQTSFVNQMTGGGNLVPQTSFGPNVTGGANMMPQTSFTNNITGGANIMPQTSFASNNIGSTAAFPQTSFGNSNVGFSSLNSFNNPQTTGGVMPVSGTNNYQSSLSYPNMTGGPQQNPQFGYQNTGGPQQNPQFGYQNTGGPQQNPQFGYQNTGGPQQNPQFGYQNTGGPQQNPQFGFQNTGGPQQNQFTGQPVQQFQNTYNTGVNGLSQSLQNTSISQPTAMQTQQTALQTQPTGFGFGNGPQLQQQQPRQANLYNATADNPFGF